MQTLTTTGLPLFRRLLASTLALLARNLPNNLLFPRLNHHRVQHQSRVHLAPQMARHSGMGARRFSEAVLPVGRVRPKTTP
jgi:hypothetical protein